MGLELQRLDETHRRTATRARESVACECPCGRGRWAVGVLPRQAGPTHRHHFRLTIARPPSVRVCPAAAHNNTCLSSFMGCARSGLPCFSGENRYRRLSSLCVYASGSAGRVSGGGPGLCTCRPAAGGRLALAARGFSGGPLDGVLLAPLAEPGRAVAADVRAYGGVRRPAYCMNRERRGETEVRQHGALKSSQKVTHTHISHRHTRSLVVPANARLVDRSIL